MASRCCFVPICPICRTTIGVLLTLAATYSRSDDTRSVRNGSMSAMCRQHVCQHAMLGVSVAASCIWRTDSTAAAHKTSHAALPAFSGYGVAAHRTFRLTACWHGACDAYAGDAVYCGYPAIPLLAGIQPILCFPFVVCGFCALAYLVRGKLARRVVNRAAALCVEDLDLLIQPAVA